VGVNGGVGGGVTLKRHSGHALLGAHCFRPAAAGPYHKGGGVLPEPPALAPYARESHLCFPCKGEGAKSHTFFFGAALGPSPGGAFLPPARSRREGGTWGGPRFASRVQLTVNGAGWRGFPWGDARRRMARS
jgi:hypothetical protein